MVSPAHFHDVLVTLLTSIVLAFLTILTAIHAVVWLWRVLQWVVVQICRDLRECAEEIARGIHEIANAVHELRCAVAEHLERMKTHRSA